MTRNIHKQVTRKELYDLVWKLPLTKVGDIYGVSNTAVRKRCKEYNIPLPDNSYRGKLNSGQHPKPRPLPITEGDSVIIFNEFIKDKIDIPEDFNYLEESIRSKANEVFKNLKIPITKVQDHKIVIEYKNEIKKQDKKIKETNFYLIPRNQNQLLNLGYLSEDNLSRAFYVFNVLFHALEQIGAEINKLDKYPVIKINNVNIEFRIKEKCNQVYETNNNNRYNISKLIPNGKLSFQYGFYFEKQITDTDSRKIDNNIGVIFKRMLDFSQEQKEEQIKFAENRRIYEIECLEKERVRELRNQEIIKVKNLLQDETLWKKAEDIRIYTNAMETKLGLNCSEEQKKYIEWARHIADWLDPTTDKNEDILKDKKDKDEILSVIKY